MDLLKWKESEWYKIALQYSSEFIVHHLHVASHLVKSHEGFRLITLRWKSFSLQKIYTKSKFHLIFHSHKKYLLNNFYMLRAGSVPVSDNKRQSPQGDCTLGNRYRRWINKYINRAESGKGFVLYNVV